MVSFYSMCILEVHAKAIVTISVLFVRKLIFHQGRLYEESLLEDLHEVRMS